MLTHSGKVRERDHKKARQSTQQENYSTEERNRQVTSQKQQKEKQETLKLEKSKHTKTNRSKNAKPKLLAQPHTPLQSLSFLLSRIPRAITSLTTRQKRVKEAKQREMVLRDDKRMIWVREGPPSGNNRNGSGNGSAQRPEWVFRTMRSYEANEMMRRDWSDHESEWSWTLSM